MADPANPTVQWPGVAESNRGFNYPSSGPNNTLEYMASGLPWSEEVAVTGSSAATKVDFPFVTSEIYVKNRGASPLAVGWTENGVLGSNKYTLLTNEDVTFRIRVKTLYLSGVSGSTTADLTVALTTIPQRWFPTLTGSAADPITGNPDFNTGSLTPEYGYNGLG